MGSPMSLPGVYKYGNEGASAAAELTFRPNSLPTTR